MNESTEKTEYEKNTVKTAIPKTNDTEDKRAPSTGMSAVWRRRIEYVIIKAVYAVMGYLLGGCEMLFGTYPLGLAFLCASGKHTLAILAGVLLATVTKVPNPVAMICICVAAALVRGVSGMLLEAPNARVELPEHLRAKLQRSKRDEKKPQTDAKTDLTARSSFKKEAAQNAQKSPLRKNEKDLSDASVKNDLTAHSRSLLSVVGEMFTEDVVLRMITGSISALLISLARIFATGFQYYDFFAALFLTALTPALVLIYSVCTEDTVKNRFLRLFSMGTLLFSCVFSASVIPNVGLSLGSAIAFFLTLTVCAERGIILGTLCALLLGIAVDPMQIPSFFFAALIFTLLHSKEKESGGVLAAGAAFLCWSAYARGAMMIPLLLPALLVAGAAFTLVRKWKSTDQKENLEDTPQPSKRNDPHISHVRCKDANERFRGISEAFTSLSEMFYNLSDRFRRPGTLDLRQICDGAFDAYCKDCPNKTVCWGLEYSATLSTVNSLISRLHTRGKVTREQIPAALKHRCNSIGAILEKINNDCARLTADMLRNNRTEIFAMDYESAANIINDALEEDAGEYRFDEELEEKIRDYLKDAEIGVGSVTVYGNRRRQIVLRGVNVDRSKVTSQTLRSDLGEMCGLELGQPIFEMEGNVSIMSLQAKKKIAVEGAKNNVSADGGVSGDSINLFANKQDYFYALISDGMGAGKEAAFTSGLCSVFLEKMLRAGNRAWTSLRMLNNMIRSRGADSVRECSSTIDLLELDLMTAQASFIKSGAAPSFVIRGDAVHRLQSGTAPIGIIQTLDAQETSVSVRTGDTLVLISDGILQNDEECEWLTSFLSNASALTPEEIVYRICLQASTFENHDDCSAVALRIIDAE